MEQEEEEEEEEKKKYRVGVHVRARSEVGIINRCGGRVGREGEGGKLGLPLSLTAPCGHLDGGCRCPHSPIILRLELYVLWRSGVAAAISSLAREGVMVPRSRRRYPKLLSIGGTLYRTQRPQMLLLC
ncbi:hypothetical protein O3P69_018231 [Scylla paramamosain]|uniref:Uncharacterized protein n=1 Tax=Scylla paramamosain TaxID=85552 RepID=A0AAW0TLK9_SCYPA